MRSVFIKGCTEDFASKTIHSVGSILLEMHKLGVTHRRIEAEIVGMSKVTKADGTQGFKVELLGGLNRLFPLPPNIKVV